MLHSHDFLHKKYATIRCTRTETHLKMTSRRCLLFKIFIGLRFLISGTAAFLSNSYTSQFRIDSCFAPSSKFVSSSMTSRAMIRIWVEDAEDGFVDEEENLEEGEVCVRAIKAFASNADTDNDKNSTQDNKNRRRFLCAGALVRRPALSLPQEDDHDSNSIVYDAWIADALLDEGGPNLQVQGATRILDDLLLYYLTHCYDNHEKCDTDTVAPILGSFEVQCGTPESDFTCASYQAAILRGFRPKYEINVKKKEYEESLQGDKLLADDDSDGLVMDPKLGYERYGQLASEQYTKDVTLRKMASQILQLLPKVRSPFPDTDQ